MIPLLVSALMFPVGDTLPVPDGYRRALDAGSRSTTGAPGPAYWQQRVDYRMSARLHPDEMLVSGSEIITYHNQSPDSLIEVWLNLPQNVFAPGNPRNRPVPITGGFTLDRVVVQGITMEVDEPRVGASLGTVVGIALPEALPTGGSAQIEIDWHFEVPEGTFRMGREGQEVFFLAQWFPQVAAYDDLRGWVQDPYLGDGEFYLDYGDYEVEITVPEGWLVGATGTLQNPQDVLTAEALARLRGAAAGVVTHVVGSGDRSQGRATVPAGPDGTLTWRYVAENVRDFAWGASDRYVWDTSVATYPGEDGAPNTAAIHTFYRPDRPNWERSAEFARHAIESHSYWYPYPYPQMTVNEGVIGGGMEYPMITIIGGGRTPQSLYGTVSHELAHMWWPMVAGSDERNHAWMDEGLASFSEDLHTPDLFPEVNGGLNSMAGYLRVAGSDRETESMRPADLYGPFGNRGLASYGKPATVFRALRGILGEETFDRGMRTYLRRWAFKHPNPLDLFWTFEDVSGQDLDWYFQPWLYSTKVMDQAVVDVRAEGERSVVVVEDRGEIPMPLLLLIRTDLGQNAEMRLGHDAWVDGRVVITLPPMEGTITEIVIDPDQVFPDVNRENNRWVSGR